MANWYDMIKESLEYNGESEIDIQFCTLDVPALKKEFDNGFGLTEGEPFTLWTDKRVYFPVVYDGAEWVASVPRHWQEGEVTHHVGGGA